MAIESSKGQNIILSRQGSKKFGGTSESFLTELTKGAGIDITTDILLRTPRNCVNLTCFNCHVRRSCQK